MFARTLNKFASRIFWMLLGFIVRFVSNRVALTMIFSSYWIFSTSIKMKGSFFSFTECASISGFWHKPSSVSIQPVMIGELSSVVYSNIIIVLVTSFLCITGKLYLWEQRLAKTSIAILSSLSLFSSKFTYMLKTSIICTSYLQNPESMISLAHFSAKDKLPNARKSCLKVDISGSSKLFSKAKTSFSTISYLLRASLTSSLE